MRGHRDPAIDGLRALAVLVLILMHAGVPQASRGYVGVDVFFVTAAFIVTSSLLREHDRAGRVSLRTYHLRRFLRLAPALALMLLIAAVIEVGSGATRPGDFLVEALKAGSFTYNIWWAVTETPFTHALSLAHTWSIAQEAQFYLLWGVVMVLLLNAVRSRRGRVVALVVLALLFTGARVVTLSEVGPLSADWWPWSRMDEFIAGGALAVGLHGSPTAVARVLRRPVVGVLAGAGLLLYLRFGDQEFAPLTEILGIPVVTVLTVLLLGHLHAAAGAGLPSRVLGLPPLRWLGRRSYGLYLFHYPIVVALAARHVSWTWAVPITLGGSVLCAALSFPLAEQPMRRLGMRLGVPAVLRTRSQPA